MRTDLEIVEQTNAIARIIYGHRGYQVEEGYEFHTNTKNRHPHETEAWNAACEIQLLMTDTDPEDALQNLEE